MSQFQNSNDELHQKIWAKTDLQASQQILHLQDGASIVESNSNYGFIIESVQADWLLKNFCHLTLAAGDLGQSRHYALAFPKGSKLRDSVSGLILKYAENGALFQLQNKWQTPSNCSSGDNYSIHNQASANQSNFSRALPFCKCEVAAFSFTSSS